ncbi:DUF3152 domain-containing protein [Streptomyces sp. NPDC006285]|uniref:DUF3152 domain-containing protein n=1 Tax=Streptomyces sp. NPDC006285 TaxID=3364742 RepID=UPI0036BBFBFA
MPRLPEGWVPQGSSGEQAAQAGQSDPRPGGRPAAGGDSRYAGGAAQRPNPYPGRQQGDHQGQRANQRPDQHANAQRDQYPNPYGDGTRAGGPPRLPDGTPAHGFPRLPDGTPAHGSPRVQDGTPAHGFPRLPDGTPVHGFPRLPDGTPAHGFPRLPDSAPARGGPRAAGGAPAPGTPRVRGGHPEQHESGGGWGETRSGTGHGAPRTSPQGPPQRPPQGPPQGPPRGPAPGGPRDRPEPPIPGQRYAPTAVGGGPRQAYVDAFAEDDDSGAPRPAGAAAAPRANPFAPVTDRDDEVEHKAPPKGPEGPGTSPDKARGGKGRAFTGIAAAAVTTVLAVVVAGHVAGGSEDDTARPQATGGAGAEVDDYASRTDKRPVPSVQPSAATLSYAQQMAVKYPLAAGLKGGGRFEAVPGLDKAPGTGQKFTYRVDVEKALGLDGKLFAQAVQKTLNDKRSWAHGGGRTFERISSGQPDFVITLASPGTTAFWCAKSGLDTTQDNVSCDSAATDRVMINAYRWAQGSETYGDKMYAYRQMLINHEVGHRLGYGHVSCSVDGGLAPVMQQQTKFLDHDGISCRPNPWPFPSS